MEEVKWKKRGGKYFLSIDGLHMSIYKPKMQQCYVLLVNNKIIKRDLIPLELKKYAKRLYNL